MQKCKYCDAPVVWLRTENNKNMIVDADSYHGEASYDASKHRAHWGTCPYAKQAREEAEAKRRQGGLFGADVPPERCPNCGTKLHRNTNKQVWCSRCPYEWEPRASKGGQP